MKQKLLLALMLFALLMPALPASAEDLPVTSPFGWRWHPISGQYKFHAGVDLGFDYGTPVALLFDGVIVEAGNFDDGYGNQVLAYHPAIDAYTRYGHMASLNVSGGEELPAGTIIGYVGSTGYSTGPHLHLEYMVRSEDGGYTYVDPLTLWE